MIQSSAKKTSRKELLNGYRTRSLLEATRKVIAQGGFDAVTMERVSAEVDADAPPWERLAQTLRAQLAIMDEQRDLIRVLLLDRRLLRDSPGGQHARRLFKYRDRHEERLRQCLDEGVRKRIFRSMDTAQAAFFINEMTVSAAGRRMMGRGAQTLERDIEELLAFVGLLVRKHARGAAG
jgi:Tetracyclin repressor-like, C-terminal domain/Bacterial regulatory proteins, tetR family